MLLRSCLRVRSLRGLQLGLQQQIRKGHDHGPLMPPFARSGPITGKVRIYFGEVNTMTSYLFYHYYQPLFAIIVY